MHQDTLNLGGVFQVLIN